MAVQKTARDDDQMAWLKARLADGVSGPGAIVRLSAGRPVAGCLRVPAWR